MKETYTKPEYRELTPEERRLFEWLIANGNAEASGYDSQVSQLKVVARCTCGCPTLDVALGERKSRTVGASTILADAVGQSPEGVPVDVILHAREGEISELEVVSHDATKVFSLPRPEMLQIA
jgi:hypothetical protein